MADAQERIGQTVGDYRLLRLLGKGRFGAVYLAEHLYEHASAAVKVLHMPLTGSNAFDVFLKEARTVRLQHPHIVSLFDFDQSRDGLPYLAMTYADGSSLRDRYPQGSQLPYETIDTYVQQIASALQYAHDCHIIHYDVKPENMLKSNDGTLLLSDFGIAKISGQANLYTQPKVIGTPAYTAPEQSQGHPCSASDQYALAIVVYEWLTGQYPFQGDHFAVALQHQTANPPSLSSINPEVPSLVEQVVFKALAKDPKDRYPTITYFAEALHMAMQEDDEPTQRHPKAKPGNTEDTPSQTSEGVPLVLSTSEEVQDSRGSSLSPQSAEEPNNIQSISQHQTAPTAPVSAGDVPSSQVAPSEPSPAPATKPFPAQPVFTSLPDANTPDVNEFHNSPTSQWTYPYQLGFSRINLKRCLAIVGARLAPTRDFVSASAKALLERRPVSSTLAKDRLKNMIQRQSAGGTFAPRLHMPVKPAQSQQPLPTWLRLIGSILIVVLIGGGFALLLNLLPTLMLSPTQKSSATTTGQVPTRYHMTTPALSPQHQMTPTPTASSQHQITPTPTPSPQPQTPTPTPPVISAAIPAGQLLYSTPDPLSACDKLGGHWTNTSDARVTCRADGSEMVNTSGNLAAANLDQLRGNPSPWSCQNCIVQVQATINPNSQGTFGIDFQSGSGEEYLFAYEFNAPSNWAFNYYNSPGNLTSTLVSASLLSPVSTQLTIDIRVQGTYYAFYINGSDTTGRAVTGSQYLDKIVGLAVDAGADVTFSNFAVFALS